MIISKTLFVAKERGDYHPQNVWPHSCKQLRHKSNPPISTPYTHTVTHTVISSHTTTCLRAHQNMTNVLKLLPTGVVKHVDCSNRVKWIWCILSLICIHNQRLTPTFFPPPLTLCYVICQMPKKASFVACSSGKNRLMDSAHLSIDSIEEGNKCLWAQFCVAYLPSQELSI